MKFISAVLVALFSAIAYAGPATVPATQPAVTLIKVAAGTEIGPLIAAARPHTHFQLLGPCTLHRTVYPPAYLCVFGGSLAVHPSPKSSAVFDVMQPGFSLCGVNIAGNAESTVVAADGPYCTVTGCTCDIAVNFVRSTSRADHLTVTRNLVKSSTSVGIYIGGSNFATVTDNEVTHSWGEYNFRTENDTDSHGNALLDASGHVLLPTNCSVLRNRFRNHNAPGKQCAGLRRFNGEFKDNICDGAVRLGEAGPELTCVVNVEGNTFLNAFGSPPTVPVAALQVIGGTHGRIANNAFTASACQTVPIAVSPLGNSLIISGNAHVGPRPLVSGDAASYELQ